MIEYRYGILSQLISEIDNYYQKTFAQFQKEALDLAKQNSSGDFEVYYTILQGFDSEDERISSLCKEVRKILFCSIFSYYEGCINAIIKYYKIETEAQQVQKLYDAISRTYEKRYLVNDLDIEANLLDYVNNFCRLLRNYFMHGDLSDNIIKKKLDCYVRNNDGVKLLDNYFIEIESKDFLFKSLDCMKTILIKREFDITQNIVSCLPLTKQTSMAGFFSKKQYAAMADSELAMKLLKERCLECSIWAMFFNSSLTVSIKARFLSRILSAMLIREFLMLFFTLVISCMPLRKRISNRA